MSEEERYVIAFAELGSDQLPLVGGKNASLGEMVSRLQEAGISVPGGFATTARAYWEFLEANELKGRIAERMEQFRRGRISLAKAGSAVRKLIEGGDLPPQLGEAILSAYHELGSPSVAVRSSATAEDLPEASFAGQLESFLNVQGDDALLDACKRCFASLFTDRAITYREHNGFDHMKVALSVGVQRMVRADTGAAGVMFTLDTETGFRDVVLIDAAWGLGETVVQGAVDPDEYMVFKPLLNDAEKPIINKKLGGKAKKMVYAGRGAETTRTVETKGRERRSFVLEDEEILKLARWAVAIERHYGKPMDIEWAKDGETGELAILQARPETVQSQMTKEPLKAYRVNSRGKRLVTGLSIGQAIAAGPVIRLASPDEAERFPDGAVLVTGMTDPDWVPVMKKAAAIVTDHGGRTSHAAIVSRELGLPAVVGTGDGTEVLKDDQEVTVSCAEGDEGFVYEGTLDFTVEDVDLSRVPETRTKVMLNLANPGAALRWWQLPADGVGLARMEFIVGNQIKIHPMALARFSSLEDREAKKQIEQLTEGYDDKAEYFVEHLAFGIARIAASQYPHPVIVRMSDFKTSEYADLIGGRPFEPDEQNPMLGWRGASRSYSEGYRDGFALECRAIRRVREQMGLANLVIMIPFCRTPEEADRVLEALAENDLIRGQRGLEVYVMCEIPSNVILAEQFAQRFDGFSIGSNDLTQLVLGVDRNAESLRALFDERNEAVTRMIEQVIGAAHEQRRKVGLCGEAPSQRPEFARFLVHAGIDSISVSPDSFLDVKETVAAAEREGS